MRHLTITALKNLKNFREISAKKSTVRSSRSQVFYKIDVYKNCAKSTEKLLYWSHFLIKSPEIKSLQYGCVAVNFAKFLGTPLLQRPSGEKKGQLKKS